MVTQNLYPIEKIKNFKDVYENGNRYKTHTSQIIFTKKNTNNNSKLSFAVIASKKVVGKKAVSRNRAKRRFRHAFLAFLKASIPPKSIDLKVVAMTNKNTLNSPWSKLIADVEKALLEMGFIQIPTNSKCK